MKYNIFDDQKKDNFYPLTLTRSCGDLRVGILKQRQRIAAYLEAEDYGIIVSESLQELYRERHPEKTVNLVAKGENLFVNSRLKITTELVAEIKKIPPQAMLFDGENIIAARYVTDKNEVDSETLLNSFENLTKVELTKGSCWEYLWELIISNAEYIKQDFEDFFYDSDNQYELEMGVTVLNPYNVWIGEDTIVKPGVVIDASQGPVILDEGSEIMSNSIIAGPAYIGKNSVIKALSRIYEGTSIGPVCKIGGEVEATIFQGYTNKQHDGFLGHSYLGEWINIGANTNNSDLKNNYNNVSAYFYPQKTKINTGSLFLGTMIGDHSKTAISTTINTGTVIGVGCNLIGNKVFKDHVTSFSWGVSGAMTEHNFEKFVATCRSVKQRRNLSLNVPEINLYRSLMKNK